VRCNWTLVARGVKKIKKDTFVHILSLYYIYFGKEIRQEFGFFSGAL